MAPQPPGGGLKDNFTKITIIYKSFIVIISLKPPSGGLGGFSI